MFLLFNWLISLLVLCMVRLFMLIWLAFLNLRVGAWVEFDWCDWFGWWIGWLTEWSIDVIDWFVDWLLDFFICDDWIFYEWILDWLSAWLSGCLIDWVFDWWIGLMCGLVGRLIDWLIGWLYDWFIDWFGCFWLIWQILLIWLIDLSVDLLFC